MKRVSVIAATALMVVLTCGVALAADAGEAGDYNIWMNLFWRVLNFVVVVGLIWYLAGNKIKDALKTRRYSIENELSELDQRKADAKQRLEDVERSISNMEEERQTILREYKAQGEAVKASIIEKAEAAAKQIQENAANAAETESRMAVEAIRAQLADLVTEATEKVLDKRLTKEEHQKLIDKYLEKVVLN